MAYRKTAVTPLITHWSYCSLALSHRFKAKPREMQPCKHTTQYKRNYYVKTTFWDNDYVFITLCVCCEGIHEDWMSCVTHEDDTWWRHQMETFSALLPICAIHRSPVNSPHKGQWRGALMFSLICARINGWVNNSEAGDLRRHCAHYDVIVMSRKLVDEHDLRSWNRISFFICWYCYFYIKCMSGC